MASKNTVMWIWVFVGLVGLFVMATGGTLGLLEKNDELFKAANGAGLVMVVFSIFWTNYYYRRL